MIHCINTVTILLQMETIECTVCLHVHHRVRVCISVCCWDHLASWARPVRRGGCRCSSVTLWLQLSPNRPPGRGGGLHQPSRTTLLQMLTAAEHSLLQWWCVMHFQDFLYFRSQIFFLLPMKGFFRGGVGFIIQMWEWWLTYAAQIVNPIQEHLEHWAWID